MKKRIIQISTLALLTTAVFTVESCRKEDPPAKTITPIRGEDPDGNGGNGGSGNGGSGNNGGGATVTGCTDQDSPNYDSNANSNDNSCVYVYVTSYEISYHPSQDGGSDWDFGLGTNADLILKIKESSSSNAIFEGAEISNQDSSSPAVWQEPSTVKLKNMNYEWTLWDYDSASSDDLMSSGTFNPLTLLSSNTGTGTITTVSGGSQLVITYSIHQ